MPRAVVVHVNMRSSVVAVYARELIPAVQSAFELHKVEDDKLDHLIVDVPKLIKNPRCFAQCQNRWGYGLRRTPQWRRIQALRN